ncbi:molybdopterin-dependent oxidoreductase iron-sulfur protein [Humibacillus xanthopallidus]|uniref:Molybdopterin-dependent oxidoreductase iron-sulfur protein n=1 Tax=Humibacillus xanthopallidus TaxID=412689 RepID=A0A543PS40_9MICO|nr:molybdopterin-dependent oxidoreductase [Humibacillus xanthopallidus]TQN46865.1 molybdopterin-dependent oxidoreductase iron-sulfur protein [Humibacillus xanthopallidus]
MPGANADQLATFCAMCVSRCGATATVRDGRLIALGPDPDHPTGRAVCVKGKAAPQVLEHPDRLLHPLRRTTPKGSASTEWVQISWDEALDTIAEHLRTIADESGPEAVVFGSASPSTSAISDSADWITRLRRAFGSPNFTNSMELCGWGRFLASTYTFGAPVPGAFMPDLDNAGCILFWGYNPSVSRLVHATATVDAVNRGARLVVVDPRRTGLAGRADHWLQVRPGTDAALALGLIHVMIENGWYDEDFVRRWTNAPLLVRLDTGRLLRADELPGASARTGYVAWDEPDARPVAVDPATPAYASSVSRCAVSGTAEVATTNGPVTCSPVLELLRRHCENLTPEAAESVTGVSAQVLVDTARTLWESRPVAYYSWSGLEQHSNTTQMIRAVNVLYALTGCLDAVGGNVLFTPVPTNPVDGAGLLSDAQRARTIGVQGRPLGPARFEFVTGEDLCTAALDHEPYRARALVNFGANLVMAHGDSARVRDALSSLDFFVHADLFMSPTAALADIVLPVASPFETEALRVGFEVSQQAQSHVQLRRPAAPPRGEARSDLQIVFALAQRLGLGEHFWDGDIDAAWRHQLAPSGITLEALREQPRGIALDLPTRHRKYEERGFRTPTGLVEIWSMELVEHGEPALPSFTEPALGPRSRPDLVRDYPLVLTCAKSLRFCESQHRQVAELRRAAPDPQVELHPDAAQARGITTSDWVRISTPHGAVRARAKLNSSIAPGVVCAQHGWSQGCDELGLPSSDPYEQDGVNLNLVLRQTPSDPVSGSSPLRSSLCEVARL